MNEEFKLTKMTDGFPYLTCGCFTLIFMIFALGIVIGSLMGLR